MNRAAAFGKRIVFVALSSLSCATVIVAAPPTEPPSEGNAATLPATTQSAEPMSLDGEPARPLPGPKLLGFRFDEDYRYLDGPEGSYRPDFFDPLKNIHINDDWRLDVGGEFRVRMDAAYNLGVGTDNPIQDTYQLYRYMTHFNLHYKDSFRTFVEIASMSDEDRELPDRPGDENKFSLQQAFLDFKPLGGGAPLTVRVGRQELEYGDGRFVATPGWGNTRRRFDAVKAFWKDDDWQLDLFYAKPVSPIRRTKFDSFDEEYDLYGAYFTYSKHPALNVDAFFLAQDVTADRTNPNGRIGDMDRYTLGARLYGNTDGFDYNAYLAGQWGHWAKDRISASNFGLDGGYTWKNVTWKPRIGAGFDWSSGDRDPYDKTVETFDPVFPFGHKYLGYDDLFYRQNLQEALVSLSAWPVPDKVRAEIAYHAFWLASDQDAWYRVGGSPRRRDVTGSSGNELGDEIDVTLDWKLDIHQAVQFTYAHFFHGNYVSATGPNDDSEVFYLQYQFKF